MFAPLENYRAWISEVTEEAADLEGLPNYRYKNTKNATTVLGAPKGIQYNNMGKICPKYRAIKLPVKESYPAEIDTEVTGSCQSEYEES